MCTGKKECLRHLNIWDIFLELKKVNPDVQIDFSKFCELQPKYVVNVNSSGIHKVCVCEYHQNVKLMLLSLPVKIDYKDVICKAVCNVDTRNCMLHLCENCPWSDKLLYKWWKWTWWGHIVHAVVIHGPNNNE